MDTSRLAHPKGPSPEAQKAARRSAIVSHERKQKALVRARDQRCRWPRCSCYWAMPTPWIRPEVAHLKNKGMGGDHGLRSDASNMILLCYAKHQGLVSLHTGLLRIVPRTKAGTDGPVRFQIKDGRRWRTIATEQSVGVLRGD